jgi:hypothetical protein
MNTVALYSRFEASFESASDYENPVQDVAVEVEFECAGTRVTTTAFWDGERTWRVRFSPEMTGALDVARALFARPATPDSMA